MSLTQAYDTRADMFSFAVMVSEIVQSFVQGRPPLPADRSSLIPLVTAASSFLDTACPPLASIIRECFREEPAGRLTAAEALRRLESSGVSSSLPLPRFSSSAPKPLVRALAVYQCMEQLCSLSMCMGMLPLCCCDPCADCRACGVSSRVGPSSL